MALAPTDNFLHFNFAQYLAARAELAQATEEAQRARQAFENAKADYEAAVDSRKSQEQLLDYYTVRAPFDGVVGDIPVHVGDYVSTVLYGADRRGRKPGSEVYVYIPTERAAEVRMGLGIDLTDNSGKVLEKTAVDFISPEVDSTLQGILVKAPVHSAAEILRNAQIVKARVIWSTKPMAVPPVLAVIRQGEESFVFVMQKQNGMAMAHRAPVVLGDTVAKCLIVSGLSAGVLRDRHGHAVSPHGMPVIPIGG